MKTRELIKNNKLAMQRLGLFVAGIIVGLGAYFLQQHLTQPSIVAPTINEEAMVEPHESGAPLQIVDGRADIVVDQNGLSHKDVVVPSGTKITWINSTDEPIQIAHTPNSNNPEKVVFASPLIEPGQSYLYEFTTPGSFSYQDLLHAERTGTIAVLEN